MTLLTTTAPITALISLGLKPPLPPSRSFIGRRRFPHELRALAKLPLPLRAFHRSAPRGRALRRRGCVPGSQGGFSTTGSHSRYWIDSFTCSLHSAPVGSRGQVRPCRSPLHSDLLDTKANRTSWETTHYQLDRGTDQGRPNGGSHGLHARHFRRYLCTSTLICYESGWNPVLSSSPMALTHPPMALARFRLESPGSVPHQRSSRHP